MKQKIWFDDGFKSTITIAYPIMKKFGLTGIVPVITNKVGKTSTLRYTSNDVRELPLMDVKDLKFLINNGWEIASHSLNHSLFFNKLTMLQTEYELKESKSWIKKILNFDATKFVVPKHRIRPEQMLLVKKYYSYIRPIPPLPIPKNKEARMYWLRQHVKFHWIKNEEYMIGELKKWGVIK